MEQNVNISLKEAKKLLAAYKDGIPRYKKGTCVGEEYHLRESDNDNALNNMQDKLDRKFGRNKLVVLRSLVCDDNGKVFFVLFGYPNKMFETNRLVEMLGLERERSCRVCGACEKHGEIKSVNNKKFSLEQLKSNVRRKGIRQGAMRYIDRHFSPAELCKHLTIV